MRVESLENTLLSTINPILKSIIKKFDVECEKDGSLLINSLKHFLGGQNVKLCESCSSLNRRVTYPVYEVGARIMRADVDFIHNEELWKKMQKSLP